MMVLHDEFYFWCSCVQVRLSTCSDMEDARALLIDVERQRLGSRFVRGMVDYEL